MTITLRSYPFDNRYSRSIFNSGSPFFTCFPCSHRQVKPFPFSFTVSIPTWIRISIPFFKVRPTAWLLGNSMVISASAHAYTVSPVEAMAKPSPIIFWENTGSFTSSIGISVPSTTARSSSLLFSFFLNPNICHTSWWNIYYKYILPVSCMYYNHFTVIFAAFSMW